MPQVFGNRIFETSVTTGTGAYTVAGAAGSAYAPFSSAKTVAGASVGAGDTFYYKVTAVDASYNDTGDWEVGVGTYVNSTSFSRTTILGSSTGSTVSWSAGTKSVQLTAEAFKTLQLGNDQAFYLPNVAAEPPSPPSGYISMYSKTLCGEAIPRWKKPDGSDHFVQRILSKNGFATVRPGGVSTITSLGTTPTNVGTVSHNTPGSGSLSASIRQAIFTSAATSAALTSHRQGQAWLWAGNASGRGGFSFVMRIKAGTLVAGNRGFWGINSDISAPTNVDPTTATAGSKIGLAINTNTGNYNLIYNAAGSAPTVVGLGASFPLNTTDVYEMELACLPNSTSYTYNVTNMESGASTGQVSISGANVPANTVFMAPLMWMTNNGTASAVAFSIIQWSTDADN